jgi:hypothetical protein
VAHDARGDLAAGDVGLCRRARAEATSAALRQMYISTLEPSSMGLSTSGGSRSQASPASSRWAQGVRTPAAVTMYLVASLCMARAAADGREPT